MYLIQKTGYIFYARNAWRNLQFEKELAEEQEVNYNEGGKMRIKSHVAKAIERAAYKDQYDTEVKKVLSNPQILSWILKYTGKEFAKYSIDEIILCIEGEAEVAAQRVTFDIRFNVRVPEQGLAEMIINVEAQNKFYESYDLVSRGIFYCARMLSGQVHNGESAEEYKNLKKVYSIWICMNAPLNSEYTITSYRMHQEKIKLMKKEYDIVTNVDLEGGLAKMCNLSEYIEEKSLEQGIEQGIEQGLAALVNSLSEYIQGEDELYQAVIKNEIYRKFSKEEVLKYCKQQKNS